MVPPKKRPTKGANQIIMENQQVISFCQRLALGPTIIHTVLSILLNIRTFKPSLTGLTLDIILSHTLLPMSFFILAYIMKKMSKPLYSEDGEVILYAGYDLNVKGGWGEIFREVMYVLVLTHIFSAVSPWFRHILWYMPLKCLYLCCMNTVVPTTQLFLKETGLIPEVFEEDRVGVKPKKNKKKIKYLRTIRHWHNFKC